MFYDFTTLNSERTSLIFSRLYLQTFSLFQFYAWLVPFHGRPGRYNQTEKTTLSRGHHQSYKNHKRKSFRMTNPAKKSYLSPL